MMRISISSVLKPNAFNISRLIAVGVGPPIKLRRKYSNSSSQESTDALVPTSNIKQRRFTYRDNLSPGPVALLVQSLKSYLNQNSYSGFLHLGYQHAFFRPGLDPSFLCDDGTDTKFLPGSQDIWKYRLWAGGSATLHHRLPPSLKKNLLATVVETADNVHVVEKEGKIEKVLVTIKREFVASRGQFPIYSSQAPGNNAQPATTPFMSEFESLCFLRDQPASLRDERKIRPISNPIFTHTMTPTPALLFQFSALTYNAHKIHFDRDFAQKEYGAKDLVVHGPLTQVLMVEFLRRFLKCETSTANAEVVPINITYTNLQPLYVDESMTLCCKLVKKYVHPSGHEVEDWSVWIQKGEGENTSLAVRATITTKLMYRDQKLESHSKQSFQTPSP